MLGKRIYERPEIFELEEAVKATLGGGPTPQIDASDMPRKREEP